MLLNFKIVCERLTLFSLYITYVGNKLTKFEDILYNCNQATDDIEEMLSNHPTDTSRIISKLENISAVTNMEIPFFDKSIFKDVTATKELWQTLSQHMPIFNYPILKEFLNIVDFKEAKQVYDNFWSRIEDREMEDVKISNYCDHCKPKMFLLLRVKVKTEAMTNLLRKNIEDVLSNKFELKFFWLINIQSVENHSVLEYYLSGALKEHLLKEFEITTIDLHNFSNNKILSIQVDDQEQKTQLVFYMFLAYMYIHTYIHTYIHMYIHTYMRTYVFMYVRTYVRTYVCMYVCLISMF